MTEIAKTIKEIRQKISNARNNGNLIGFVPTMGALHKGHLSLVKKAKQDCGYVVVSIFVNPTQFGQGEDFGSYPRPFENDRKFCEDEGVDIIFNPEPEEIYPEKFSTYVVPQGTIVENLCGIGRPGHFKGVDTIVLKLFNICKPDRAYFGQKDYQQSVVIRKMVEDLNLEIDVIVCPTIRESDGLAMSSRNSYLNPEQRKKAACLYNALLEAKKAVESEKITAAELVKKRVTDIITETEGAQIDYIEIVDSQTLESLDRLSGKVVVALAVRIGSARLIDNMILNAS